MNTCDECRYWERNNEEKRRDMKSCIHPKMLKGYGIKAEQVMPDGIIVENDEGWGFFTGPKFGCVHWESEPQFGEQVWRAKMSK